MPSQPQSFLNRILALLFIGGFVLFTVISSNAIGQEDAAKKENATKQTGTTEQASAKTRDYATCMKQWKTLNAALTELEPKASDSEENQKQYTQMVSDANELIEELRTHILAEIRTGKAETQCSRRCLAF